MPERVMLSRGTNAEISVGDSRSDSRAWFGWRALNDMPISQRLWLMIVLNSSLALLLAGFGTLVYQRYVQRNSAVEEIRGQASVLAESAVAALSFEDVHGAQESLSALRGDSDMMEAAIFDRQGRSFATYIRGPAYEPSIRTLRPDGVYFDGDDLTTFQPVSVEGERVGTIVLRSATNLSGELRRNVAIRIVVFLLSLGIALFLSAGIQRTIAVPIRELSRVACRVKTEKEYSARASVRGGAELGILIDSFNQMLAEIERRDLAHRAAEERLRESEERYALAARGANDGLWDWKLTTGEIYFSVRWIQMIGYQEGEITSDPHEWFGRIHLADVGRVRAEVAAHQSGVTAEFTSEYRMRHSNGSFVWMLSRGAVVRDESGAAVRMAGSQTDITEGKVVDPLTGLPNRLYFLDRLDAAVEREAGFAVLFIDLDRFKLVNDSLGHAAGDELLTGVAGRIKGTVRGADIAASASGSSVVARLGGDEFAVLLTGVSHISEAQSVADRILAELSAPFQIAGRQVFGMISIGIAPGAFGQTPEDILRNADTAMYHAKAKGKGRWEVFDETMHDRVRARMETETDLRRAIELNQFVLYYQPQISLQTGRVCGYEALVRWKHPGRGLIPPAEFIPVAEETDLIVPLGRIVLREACRQMAEWQKIFENDPPLSVSVNISGRQLNGTDLLEDVRSALLESGLPAASLRLEVTESSVMTNTAVALDVLGKLKELGVGLEIDDFGTGYSSLSYLNRLPFDTVKIDRSFVKDLHLNSEAADIVRTILDLAASMNMNVIAEGVENDEQLAALSQLGCQYGQGYYFSKPVDTQTTQALMRERFALRRAFGLLGGSQQAAVGTGEVPAATPQTCEEVPSELDTGGELALCT